METKEERRQHLGVIKAKLQPMLQVVNDKSKNVPKVVDLSGIRSHEQQVFMEIAELFKKNTALADVIGTKTVERQAVLEALETEDLVLTRQVEEVKEKADQKGNRLEQTQEAELMLNENLKNTKVTVDEVINTNGKLNAECVKFEQEKKNYEIAIAEKGKHKNQADREYQTAKKIMEKAKFSAENAEATAKTREAKLAQKEVELGEIKLSHEAVTNELKEKDLMIEELEQQLKMASQNANDERGKYEDMMAKRTADKNEVEALERQLSSLREESLEVNSIVISWRNHQQVGMTMSRSIDALQQGDANNNSIMTDDDGMNNAVQNFRDQQRPFIERRFARRRRLRESNDSKVSTSATTGKEAVSAGQPQGSSDETVVSKPARPATPEQAVPLNNPESAKASNETSAGRSAESSSASSAISVQLGWPRTQPQLLPQPQNRIPSGNSGILQNSPRSGQNSGNPQGNRGNLEVPNYFAILSQIVNPLRQQHSSQTTRHGGHQNDRRRHHK